MTESHHPNIEERLSRLEATVETFVVAVQKDIQDITAGLDSLRRSMSENSKPQWQTLFGGLTVALMLGAFIGSSYVKDLRRNERGLADIERDVLNILSSDAASRERIIALERKVFGQEPAGRTVHEH